jgi:cell division protein FtsB
MTKPDLGLPSDSKAITYQQNRDITQLRTENEKMKTTVKELKELISYLEAQSTSGKALEVHL